MKIREAEIRSTKSMMAFFKAVIARMNLGNAKAQWKLFRSAVSSASMYPSEYCLSEPVSRIGEARKLAYFYIYPKSPGVPKYDWKVFSAVGISKSEKSFMVWARKELENRIEAFLMEEQGKLEWL